MDSIGEILRNERTDKGLSLQEVNDATRITVQNLSALEEDRFDYFPNRVYARAFLRDYANFLGLDSAALLARYEDGLTGDNAEPAAAPVRSGGSPWRAVVLSVLGLLVLAALATAFYFGSGYGKKPGVPATAESKASEVSGDVATLPNPAENMKPEDIKPEAPPTAAGDNANDSAAAAPDKLVLVLKTKQHAVWVQATADGELALQGQTLPAQHVKTIEAQNKITVVVGLANQIEATLNGKPVSFGTQSGRSEKTFTLDDLNASDNPAQTPPAETAAPTTTGGPN